MNRKFVAKSNFVLRRVLNTEENLDILKEFIEVILNIEIKEAKIPAAKIPQIINNIFLNFFVIISLVYSKFICHNNIFSRFGPIIKTIIIHSFLYFIVL